LARVVAFIECGQVERVVMISCGAFAVCAAAPALGAYLKPTHNLNS